jgi:hypothetical protein
MFTVFRLRRSGVSIPADSGSESAEGLKSADGQTIFRNFCIRDFRPTDGWRCLKQIIDGNGGCFGLYGPRGSGKSWLMHRAISEVEENGGLGLWFPCPGKYDANDFLFTLTDNLANAVERRLARNKATISALNRLRNFLAIIALALLVLALILAAAHGLTADGKTSPHTTVSFSGVYPAWMWILIAIAAAISVIVGFFCFVYNTAAKGSLLREAAALRERIRFSEDLRLSAAFGISGSQSIAPTLSQSRERTLRERPTTVASLVFDFRNFAAHIVKELKRPLLVCVDELDKIEDTDEVRSLLRDIKGIFEVVETVFLVSISEEAAASLQIGVLQTGGKNELNSSFFSIVALSPLDPEEAGQLLRSRGFGHVPRLACALCLLAAGNRRELIRMADLCTIYARQREVSLDENLIIGLLADESLALLQEITRSLPVAGSAAADDDEVKYRAWTALSRQYFVTKEGFVELGINAIRELWEPEWTNDEWVSVSESWRRLLIRLFVAAKVLPPGSGGTAKCLLDNHKAALGLQETLVMATRDASVARLMLRESFGADLRGEYEVPVPRGAQ